MNATRFATSLDVSTLASSPIQSKRHIITAPAPGKTKEAQPIEGNTDHSSVLSFLYAFTIYMTLLTGSVTLAWSMILNSAWLGLAGFLIALVGCALFGRSHSKH